MSKQSELAQFAAELTEQVYRDAIRQCGIPSALLTVAGCFNYSSARQDLLLYDRRASVPAIDPPQRDTR